MRKLTYLTLSFAALLYIVLTSCQAKSYEPEVKPYAANIYYQISFSDEMLDYFDITAHYTDPDLNRTSVHMDEPSLFIMTSTDTLPTERLLNFTVVPKEDLLAAAEAPTWTSEVDITVELLYRSGDTKDVKSVQKDTYRPQPDKFDSWRESFIRRMNIGYQTNIIYNGNVNFSE